MAAEETETKRVSPGKAKRNKSHKRDEYNERVVRYKCEYSDVTGAHGGLSLEGEGRWGE